MEMTAIQAPKWTGKEKQEKWRPADVPVEKREISCIVKFDYIYKIMKLFIFIFIISKFTNLTK